MKNIFVNHVDMNMTRLLEIRMGGIAPGTAFEDIPDDWVCPICGAGKDEFAEA